MLQVIYIYREEKRKKKKKVLIMSCTLASFDFSSFLFRKSSIFFLILFTAQASSCQNFK